MTNFEPIKGNESWNVEPGIRVLNEDKTAEIEQLLMGHKVTAVDDDHLVLDNGTVIKAVGNDGGCSCGAGDYDLSVLNSVDNIITRVEFDYQPADDGTDYEHEGHYRIFVYADNQQINLMQFDGDDGNGYYGTGFELLIREVTSQ